MAAPYPQQGGYQQAVGGQPVVIQVVQQQKSSSDSFLKVCGCLAGTGLAIFIGIVGGILVLTGSIILGIASEPEDDLITGIVLVSIGGFLMIGSCYACSRFRKDLNDDNNGRVYAQPQVATAVQPLISPVVPQPSPGAGYPGPQYQPPPGAGYVGPLQQQPPPGAYYPGPQQQPPPGAVYPGPQQHQQYPMPPPGYSAPGAMQQPSYGPGYIPGQMGGTIPEQPAPSYSSKAGEAAAASAPMPPPSDQTSEYERPPAYAP